MKTPAVRNAAEQAGMEVALSTPDELARFQLSELSRWGQIIKTAGIVAE